MLARVFSAALVGVEAALVRVEVDVTRGLPTFTTVGLPDSAIRESRERVRTAIRNAGFPFPPDRITVNLAPADLRKAGAAFDLPIALGILTATGAVAQGKVGRVAVVGELALDGHIHPVRGVLAVGLACRRQNVATILVPADNRAEAAAVSGLRVLAASTLRQAVAMLNGDPAGAEPSAPVPTAPVDDDLDFDEVHGQAHAKRALEIAAAGAHNALLVGPPGGGQTVYIGRRTLNCARIPPESLVAVSVQWLPQDPGGKGRRLELRSCLSLESLAPASVRWLEENQGEHRCQCGCGEAIRLQPRHYWRVLQLKEAGYLTASDVARALGIGVTTLRRREGTIYPRATRIGGIRVYHEADVELLRRRDKVPPTATGGKQPWR